MILLQLIICMNVIFKGLGSFSLFVKYMLCLYFLYQSLINLVFKAVFVFDFIFAMIEADFEFIDNYTLFL